jgi:hypothetical protein
MELEKEAMTCLKLKDYLTKSDARVVRHSNPTEFVKQPEQRDREMLN